MQCLEGITRCGLCIKQRAFCCRVIKAVFVVIGDNKACFHIAWCITNRATFRPAPVKAHKVKLWERMHPFYLIGVKRAFFIFNVNIANTNTFTKTQVFGVTKFLTNFIAGIVQRNNAVIDLMLAVVINP